MESMLATIIVIIIGYILMKIWKYIIFPFIVKKTTHEVEKNPKWITPKIKTKLLWVFKHRYNNS